ncbi:hypothetical protein TorRG33x02_308220 [Trema orientale]|uniref:Uncharacterized protein n=1 Tax=Trema orientale TaxID=63057 RepID=A0A2P5BUU9_TREOI|nr:hypothetical protein TorRG33x02_308220 [Trema orientale]
MRLDKGVQSQALVQPTKQALKANKCEWSIVRPLFYIIFLFKFIVTSTTKKLSSSSSSSSSSSRLCRVSRCLSASKTRQCRSRSSVTRCSRCVEDLPIVTVVDQQRLGGDVTARVVIAEEDEAPVGTLDLQAVEAGQGGVSLDVLVALPDLVGVSQKKV